MTFARRTRARSALALVSALAAVSATGVGYWIWRTGHPCTEVRLINADTRSYGRVAIHAGEARIEFGDSFDAGAVTRAQLCGSVADKWYVEFVPFDGGVATSHFLDGIYLDVPGSPRAEIVLNDAAATSSTSQER